MFKKIAIKSRKLFHRYPRIINLIDHRPHWARVLEALHYQQFIDRKTPYDEIDEANTQPIGLSVEKYKTVVEFLDSKDLINFCPQEGETFNGVTKDGFKWIKDRQRTKSQEKQSRATSKLTLALLIVSTVTFLDLSGNEMLVSLLLLFFIGGTVVYDILIRDY